MSTGLNVGQDDPYLGVDKRIRINEEIKTRVKSVDDLSEEERAAVMNLPAPIAIRVQPATNWFRKF